MKPFKTANLDLVAYLKLSNIPCAESIEPGKEEHRPIFLYRGSEDLKVSLDLFNSYGRFIHVDEDHLNHQVRSLRHLEQMYLNPLTKESIKTYLRSFS